MPDRLTPEQRHKNMAAIHSKDTRPEMIVRKWLWGHGYRYRLNHPRLPGKPDVVMRKYRTCIFVNGCFWHGHGVELGNDKINLLDGLNTDLTEVQSSECCKIPKSNRTFWLKKILRNRERDAQVQEKLALMGWHSITIWECQLSRKLITPHTGTEKTIREQTLESLCYTLNKIYLKDHAPKKYTLSDEPELMAAEPQQAAYETASPRAGRSATSDE